MCDLSIVVPTFNRADLLNECLDSIQRNTRCNYEIVVVDGASSDHTSDVLNSAGKRLGNRLRVIRETQREGFVRATNKGFRAARGEHMIWINDDARPLAGAFDTAIEQLHAAPENTAFVALFHRWNSVWNVAYETRVQGRTYRLCHVRGTLYANFALGRRETFKRLNYFDERFYVCGADPDLSLKAWYAEMSVVPAWGALIDHDELDDERRLNDAPHGVEDNRLLFEKWNLPPRDSIRNGFDPLLPCTLRNIRKELCCA